MDNTMMTKIHKIVLDIHHEAKSDSARIASMNAEIDLLSQRGISKDKYFLRSGSLYRNVPGGKPVYVTRDPEELSALMTKRRRGERVTELVAVSSRLQLRQAQLLTNLQILHNHLD
jgi:hypothetical protein